MTASNLTLVRTGLPAIDDCPVLTRLKAFIVDQGVLATLEHTVRDRTGNPIDLSAELADSDSASSASGPMPAGSVRLRAKEFLGVGPSRTRNPIWDLIGWSPDPVGGVVRATLPASLVERAGLYELSWAALAADTSPLVVDRGLLSVERSLFPVSEDVLRKDLGPPTLQELRMRVWDSSANENLLLDDIEFKDEQVMLAVAEPVRLWNETPPPISTYTTRDFPWRGAWISGITAQLHLAAANNYRRNRLAHTAGGITVDDKNKEREYMAEGTRLWKEYKDWLEHKKLAININLFNGHAPSEYMARSGW